MSHANRTSPAAGGERRDFRTGIGEKFVDRQPIRFLAPSLAKPSTWRKALEIQRQTSGGGHAATGDLPDRAELLSIAVDPRQRGTGIAADLYHDLVAWFRAQGVLGFRIIVGQDPPNAPPTMASAHRFYQKMGAHPLQTHQVHQNQESVVYFQRIEEKNATHP